MLSTISLLVEAVNLAQSRGAFLIPEAAQISPALTKANDFIKSQEQTQDSPNQNAPMEVITQEEIQD